MRFEEAVRLSIRAYYEGTIPEATFAELGEVKYSPEYFAALEQDIIDEMKGDKKKKTGKRLDEEEEIEDDAE
jgi:hypothetical protein